MAPRIADRLYKLLWICALGMAACSEDTRDLPWDSGTSPGDGDGSGPGGKVDGGSGDGDGDGDTPPGTGNHLPPFSFFVTSLKAMRELSGSPDGFGGDLRFGEVGPGAGLRGADKICETVAERSMPGSKVKQWRAFLSTQTIDAKDRVGSGPWYDRAGRLVANDLTDLIRERPVSDALITEDLPNEDGVPNHNPDGTGTVDNHDVLTATNEQGRYDGGSTCEDWTSASNSSGDFFGGGSGPRIGHSWSARSGRGWMNAHTARGCAAGVNLSDRIMNGAASVGAQGGYGAIYCFALTP